MKSKVLSILLSAVVSFALFIYVITVVSPESEQTYYDIPIVMQNKDILAERGLMIVGDEPNVTLALKSDRTILNDLNESNINVLVNLANIEKADTYHLTYNISYPGNIPDNEVSVLSSSTDLITLKVENRLKKPIPVVVEGNGTKVKDGYIGDPKDAQLDVITLDISGPESVVSQIEKAVINVDLTDKTTSIVGEQGFVLCDKDGKAVESPYMDKVTVSAEKINMVLSIQRTMNVALKLNVVYGGGATEDNCTITQDLTEIEIAGSDAQLEALLDGRDYLEIGTVNLAEILESQTLTFRVQDVLQDDITNRTGIDEVNVEVKFSDKLVTETYSVTTITAINVPETLNAEVITKALQVKVRGPKNLIKELRSKNLSVVVDLAEAQTGTANIKAEVIADEAFKDVGAVGTYQVSVKLSDK